MSDFIAIDTAGLEELQEKLKQLPQEAKDEGVDEANKYILNSLRMYPSQVYVSRKSAYPEVGGWFSEKQRRFVMAGIRNGTINLPYRRTQGLSRAWQIIGSGEKSIIANEAPYAGYVQGDSKSQQARMAKKGGWQGIDVFLKARLARIIEKFDAGVKKAIRKLGL